jgi:superfamily II DNA helicase RecQ
LHGGIVACAYGAGYHSIGWIIILGGFYMSTEFSIITDSSSSLQISISGSRLEVLGFSHGRRVSITEEYGRISISLIPVIDSQPLQFTDSASDDSVVTDVPVLEPESVADVQTEPVPEVSTVPSSHLDILEPQVLLFQRLAGLRRQLALDQSVPAYVIFHDKTLHEIARVVPVDIESFGRISGVGASRIEKYGSRFLEVIREHLQEQG